MRVWVAWVVVVAGCSAPIEVSTGDTLDFGVLELGASRATPLALWSQSSWSLARAESTGAPVSFPPFLEAPDSVFSLTMDPRFGLTGPFDRDDFAVQHYLALEATFDPPALAAETPFASTLTLTFTSTEGATEQVKLALRGVGLPFTCGTLPAVRFEAVALGDERTLSLDFENPRAELDQVSLFLRDSVDLGLTPSGTFTLQGRETVHAELTWRPRQFGFAIGALEVSPSRLCPLQRVQVLGQCIMPFGVARDAVFPLTPVGRSSTAALRLQNFVRREVVVDSLTVHDGPEFAVPARAVLPPATLAQGALVPGEQDVPITFTPRRAGPHAATLALDLPEVSGFEVLLFAEAGGPDVELAPRAVRLTPVDGVAEAHLVLLNLGTSGSQLRLGTPAWAVRALDGGSPDEVCVGAYKAAGDRCLGSLAGYDPAVGLAAWSQLAVPVRVAPTSPGPRRYAVDFFSDDVDEPVITAELVLE